MGFQILSWFRDKSIKSEIWNRNLELHNHNLTIISWDSFFVFHSIYDILHSNGTTQGSFTKITLHTSSSGSQIILLLNYLKLCICDGFHDYNMLYKYIKIHLCKISNIVLWLNNYHHSFNNTVRTFSIRIQFNF